MSTRCQIRIEGNKALLYIHSDGYPEGILPTLMSFLPPFMKDRGYDPEYLAARLLQQFMNKSDKRMEEFRVKFPGPTRFDYTGFGVDVELHGDIRYLYVVKKNGSVEVQLVGGFGENQSYVSRGLFLLGTTPEAALAELKAGEDEE